ncbi:MAG: protoporphyrinogen oxidase [Methanobacteriota archaeon]|nr:MAG: protoporphyrinogen oxidase [Euryarchaeota archaeon]
MAEVVIVGGGISGLATAYAVEKQAAEAQVKARVTVVEKEERLGGKVRSIREEGFLCEAGPAGFLDSRPETLELAKELGLEPLPSNDAAKKRFIYTGGRLRPVPDGPKSFIRSDILSLRGKLRILLEPFTRPSSEEDESIAAFGRRHLGREAEEKLIGPMVIGIHAGDSERLSLQSCFPVMKELEREGGGSLLKAVFRRMKKAREDPDVKAAPAGRLTSFKDGVQSLTDALGKAIDGPIILGKGLSTIKREGGRYTVVLEGGAAPVKADALVLALPAYAAAKAVAELDGELSGLLGEIPYAPAAVVCLGYRREDVPHPLDGFGFLIPKSEERRILGCRWESSTFRHRAPPGKVLLWSIVGGAIEPELPFLDDEGLIRLVRSELREILGIERKPVYTRIFRHERAIPQYVVGHEARLKRIEERLQRYPGLFLTGNAYRGVGLNDCTRNAPLVAGKVVDYLKGR